MATHRITTTRNAELQAFGTGGMIATDAWAALSSLLERDLSPAHAALLAEPHPGNGIVDWYTKGTVAPVRLADAPADVRAAAEATLAKLTNDIHALAEKLEKQGDQSSRFLGALLRDAIKVPEPAENYVYVAGSQPVLAAWAHTQTTPGSVPVELRGFRAAPDLPMPILPPPSPPGQGGPGIVLWLLALLAALLLLGAALFLLWRDPFNWLQASFPQQVCEVQRTALDPINELREEADREGRLRLELAELLDDAAARRAACPPPPPPPPPPEPPPPPPPPPPPNNDADIVRERGGQTGRLQIILAWDDRTDLDLHVICPNGQRIHWNRRSTCGGVLDVDANARGTALIDRPVENIRWANPASGTYRIEVHNYEARTPGQRPSPFRLTIRQEGQPDRVITGTSPKNSQARITEVVVP